MSSSAGAARSILSEDEWSPGATVAAAPWRTQLWPRATPVDFSSQRDERPDDDLSAPWVDEVIKSLNRILSLPDNWNSYGSRSISRDRVRVALQLLAQIMEKTTSPPSIVPLANGSLQIEWHENDYDIEIEILGTNRYHLFWQNLKSGPPSETIVTHDIASLQNAVRGLQRP